jgi:hypothetical protein
MKFGDHLERESVPEWSLRRFQSSPSKYFWYTNQSLLDLDNLDYNSIKHEIKMHTTRDQATAMAIPGQKDEALSRFEDGLYMELDRQHERLQLFVSSKADEISRRLGMSLTCSSAPRLKWHATTYQV